jgi:hypothetical protein
MPPQSVADVGRWLPEINHDPNGFDPARTVNCGSCALAVDQRLSGVVPDATAGIGTLSTPQMEAATGLQQVPATPAQIEQYLINQGAGAHTVVGVDRANGYAGHWFNAYYDGQNVYAIDGQTGQILGWPPGHGPSSSASDELGHGSAKMKPEQVALAAELLNMDPQVAADRAYDVRDGIIRVSSDIRGVGTVLVGPDSSVLFFASYIGIDEALAAWDKGARTPRKSFAALHVQPDVKPHQDRG